VTGEPTRSAKRPGIEASQVATGRGDDGTTGLLYGGRIAKDDPRTEAYGTVDEAVSALGVARAEAVELQAAGGLPSALTSVPDTLLALQRDLFVAGAELAVNPEAVDRLRDGVTRVDESMVERVEGLLHDAEAAVGRLDQFVVPGATRLSADLELARAVVRRAERRAVTVSSSGWVLPYLNRLADYLWVLARQVEAAQAAEPAHLVARLAGSAKKDPGAKLTDG
jgi:cob(I)alamin adenosyltransferase